MSWEMVHTSKSKITIVHHVHKTTKLLALSTHSTCYNHCNNHHCSYHLWRSSTVTNSRIYQQRSPTIRHKHHGHKTCTQANPTGRNEGHPLKCHLPYWNKTLHLPQNHIPSHWWCPLWNHGCTTPGTCPSSSCLCLPHPHHSTSHERIPTVNYGPPPRYLRAGSRFLYLSNAMSSAKSTHKSVQTLLQPNP